MKTIKTWLTTIAILLCSITASAHDFEVDGIYYKITSDTDFTVAVSFRGDNYWDYDEYIGTVNIPSTVTYNSNTYRVTIIGYGAFEQCSSLTSITIPKGVTLISAYAFLGCSSLTSITIPESVTSISDGAFGDCSSLTSITIPESVTSISDGAFNGCSSLTSITIPKNVSYVGYNVFSGCTGELVINSNISTVQSGGSYQTLSSHNFSKITFGEGVTHIPDEMFFNLKTHNASTIITIPKSVTSLGSHSFQNCPGELVVNCDIPSKAFANAQFTRVTIGDGVTTIGSEAFRGCSSLRLLNIHESLTKIGDYAFANCNSLVSLNIPEGVISIGGDAFQDCNGLEYTFIPKSVKEIGSGAFTGCTGELTLECDIPSLAESFQWGGQFGGSKFSQVFISGSVTTIGNYAFSGNDILTSIIISDEVTSIGYGAFSGCSNLTSITLPESLTSIGGYAFYGCGSLTSIILPKGLTSIGERAFANCNGLASISIPENVTEFAPNSFEDCNLKTVFWKGGTLPNNLGQINYTANSDYASYSNFKVYPMLNSMFEVDGVKYVPTSMSDRTCDVVDYDCNRTEESVEIGATVSYRNVAFTVNEINDYTFYGHKYIKEVSLANQGSIGANALANCTELTSVNIAEGVASIGESAFSGCNKLEAFVLPASVSSVGNNMLSNCNALTTLAVANGNAKYDSRNNCNAIVETETNKLVAACNQTRIPESVTAIDDYAFSGCGAVTSVNIHENISSIGDYAFSGCSSLADVTIEDRTEVLTLGSNGNRGLFADCPLDLVYIGGKISYDTSSSKGYSPFSSNTTLRTVTITDKEDTIYPYEFYNCSALKNLTIGDGVTSIGDYAFSGCSSLENFSFGCSMKTIGTNAFLGCSKMKEISSSAVNPPMCGDNALDDLDKWNCTLYVPVGYMAPYQAADQWKEFLFIEDIIPIKRYAMTYMVNDTIVYHVDSLAYKEAIILPDDPIKEGHTFNGWEGVPETMPIHDVTVNALFTINKYVLSYVVDGEVHMADSITYGDSIVVIAPLEREGHTFSGWVGAPETMPAKDTTIVGSFIVNSYLLTYTIDGDTIQSDSVAYGSEITMLEAPVKAGYSFDGWDQVVTVMPAEDVVINGSYTRLPIENYVISDSDESFTLEEDLLCNEITYTRTFKNTNWNALYVPFEIPLSALADNYDIAYINDIHTWANEESGEIEKMTMEVIKITDADAVLNANHPYLIRPKSEEAKQMNLVVNDATLYAAEEVTLDCSSMYTKFEVTGSYRRRTVEDLKGSLVLGGGTWITMTEGTMNPFRLFLTITNREGSPVKINPEAAKSISIRTRGEDDGTTDIEYTEEAKTIELIYDLHGRRVSAPQKGGLYIVNGKKIIY